MSRSQVDTLIELGKALPLFHTPDGIPYAEVTNWVDGHRELRWIRDRREPNLDRWLTHKFYKQTGRLPGERALRSALQTLKYAARVDGEEADPWQRIREGRTGPSPFMSWLLQQAGRDDETGELARWVGSDQCTEQCWYSHELVDHIYEQHNDRGDWEYREPRWVPTVRRVAAELDKAAAAQQSGKATP